MRAFRWRLITPALALALLLGLPSLSLAGHHCPKVPCRDGTPPKKYALIVDGHNTLDFSSNPVKLYDILTALGYEVTFLSPRYQEADYKGKAKGTTTLPAVEAAFNELGAKVRCCDDVLISFFAHGWSDLKVYTPEKAAEEVKKWDSDKEPGKWNPSLSLNPYEKSKISGKEAGSKKGGDLNFPTLAKWLDKIKSCDVKVHINACYSGSFLGLKNSSQPEGCYCRTVFTSSKPWLVSYGPGSFITGYGEVPSKDGGPKTFEEVFKKAKKKMEAGIKKWKLRHSDTPQVYEGDIQRCLDPDGDNICTGEEQTFGTDPNQADSDGDKVTDGQEIADGTDPLKRDTDGDKLTDGEEKEFGSDPKKKDTDGDGLEDKYELFSGTDPRKADTDGDGVSDGDEVLRLHTNPLEADKPKKKKTASAASSDVSRLATTFPKGPMVRAYLYMAAEAHDRYRDLDGAHDWLDRALELDPYNETARAMLDKVKAEEQQVGMGRMGVALGTLTIMLERMEEERWREEHHEEWEEHHPEEGH